MITRILSDDQYEKLQQTLLMKAHTEPLEASYTVTLQINDKEYAVKLQPEKHHKVAVLQALQISRCAGGPDFLLITQNNILSSLLEIILYQGIN